jgi:hypothetical protein
MAEHTQWEKQKEKGRKKKKKKKTYRNKLKKKNLSLVVGKKSCKKSFSKLAHKKKEGERSTN